MAGVGNQARAQTTPSLRSGGYRAGKNTNHFWHSPSVAAPSSHVAYSRGPRWRNTQLVLSLLVIFAVAGCGGSSSTTVSVVKTVTTTTPGPVASTSTTPTPTTTVAPNSSAEAGTSTNAHANNPAQQPRPGTTVSCGAVPVGQACSTATLNPSNPNQFPQRNCDTNIVSNSATSCHFADNAFYEYYRSSQDAASPSGQTLSVYSPATGKNYTLSCVISGFLVTCTSEPLSTGSFVSFPQQAIDDYTPAQAHAYGKSAYVGNPPPLPTTTGAIPSTPTEAPSTTATQPPQSGTSFCTTHTCIPNFPNGNGYIVQCADGEWSHSGGLSGACSDHGGES
jgi:hypothetical protein